MPSDPAAMMRHFNSITRDRDRVTHDVASWSRRLKHWCAKELTSQPEAIVSDNPVVVARALHHRLCRAAAINWRSWVPRSIRAWLAAASASAVADVAVEAASATGRLADLDAQIRAIQAREGIDPDDDGTDGPEEYLAALAEHDALSRQAFDTTLSSVLRKYGFRSLAGLVASHRGRFDALVEKGRSRLFGPPSAVKG
jgi:hypothetical protein